MLALVPCVWKLKPQPPTDRDADLLDADLLDGRHGQQRLRDHGAPLGQISPALSGTSLQLEASYSFFYVIC